MLLSPKSTILLNGRNATRYVIRLLNGAAATAVPFNKSSTSTVKKEAGYISTNNSRNSIQETSKNGSFNHSSNLNRSLGGRMLEAPAIAHSDNGEKEINWYTSWYGIGSQPFDPKVQEALGQPLETQDIEVKPDGLIYLPEIKYRRILNKAFGAGGWGLVPRSETIVTPKLVTREYGLICHGQLVSVARGEQDYFSESGIPTATEGCKSNALMRCCKDLGVGSELWDPVFIKNFKSTQCVEKFVEHITTKKKKKIWLRKDRQVEYPYR